MGKREPFCWRKDWKKEELSLQTLEVNSSHWEGSKENSVMWFEHKANFWVSVWPSEVIKIWGIYIVISAFWTFEMNSVSLRRNPSVSCCESSTPRFVTTATLETGQQIIILCRRHTLTFPHGTTDIGSVCFLVSKNHYVDELNTLNMIEQFWFIEVPSFSL